MTLLGRQSPLAAPAIAAALDLPRTTVHELLKTLEARGFIDDAGGSSYRLGMRIFELGRSFERDLDLVEIGKRGAEAVAAECGETVQIALLDQTDVVYVVQVSSIHAVQLVSRLGGRLPAHLTGVGKASLAFQPGPVLQELYPPGRPLQTMTPASLATTDALHSALEQVRADGVAWDNCESNPDVYCVAAPIRDASGRVVAGMSISVPVHRWNDVHAEELRTLVIKGAQDVSAKLGLAAYTA
ncbi:IclR family transcriptional regulator [Dactylosporangium sp. CA-233914]|uniref:IclR family transcriptional regulator n=1 Tax=Dactylosporangium sp. CA-233914 TaxID=3239934 RepID=UPI003D8CC020